MPMVKLTKALKDYKNERISSQDSLIKSIHKVNLDKSILLREKQQVLWTLSSNQRQSHLEHKLRQEKVNRY